MEQTRLGVCGLAAIALGAMAGCVVIPASDPPAIVMTPAAQTGDSRPIELHPPLDLATNYQEAIVRLVVDVSATSTRTCTGTLIAEDLVVTAHHCVARRDPSGRVLLEDVAADKVNVELGTTTMPWGEVGVAAIVTPDCGYEAGGDGGDIAVLVLKRKLVGVATIQPSAEAPKLDQITKVFGFGVCAGQRWRAVELAERAGGKIEFEDRTRLWGSAAICPGDSGGPVFVVRTDRQSGEQEMELVGVVSTSVMDPTATQMGVSNFGFSNFTRIDGWTQILSAAHEIARGATSSELPPYRSCAAPTSPQVTQAKSKAKAH